MDILSIVGNLASITGLAQQNSELIGKSIKVLFPQKEFKEEIAIVLDITQPCVNNVEKYLKSKNIDASIISISKKDGTRVLDPYNREEWENIVKEYSRLINSIYEKCAPTKLHTFFSAPSSLTFCIGCVIRTLHRPYIYQFNNTTQMYDCVLIATDELRY